MIDETGNADNDIEDGKLLFIGSNKEKFNFNIRKPWDFISAICNGKISLKETETKQRELNEKTEKLKDYILENAKEKEEINRVLMQAKDMLEYRDEIIEDFRNGIFSFEHLKKSDAATYNYVLKDVSKFIKKIESMAENINLSSFNEFFDLSSVDYAKYLINLKNTEENKEFVTEAKNRISALKVEIKKKNEQKWNKRKAQIRH